MLRNIHENVAFFPAAPPTLATDGVDIRRAAPGVPFGQGFRFDALAGDDEYSLLIRMSAAAAATIDDCQLWGYSQRLGKWFLVTDINGGAQLVSDANNEINHGERVRGLREFQRVSVTGTVVGGAVSATVELVRR